MPTIRNSIGTSTANCYVSEASANSYFDERYNSQAWDDLGGSTNATAVSSLKAQILIQATREIDNTFRFFGNKYNFGVRGQSNYQNLEFPRSTDYDASGVLYIEDEVKFATYEQALWILQRTQPRRDEGENIVNRSIIGKDTYNFLRMFVNRQIKPTGKHTWQ